MVWAWDAILVLGLAHLAISAPSYEDRNSVPLVRREPTFPSEDNNELRRSAFPGQAASSFNRIEMVKDNLDDESAKAILGSPILYHLREELRPSDSSSLRFPAKDSELSEGPFWHHTWRPNVENLLSFENLQNEDSDVEKASDEDSSFVSSSLSGFNNAQHADKDIEGNLEPIWLRKRRLQMKGPGLFGSSFSRKMLGQKTLMGYTGSKNKGLVLSIDLGIKALRDAILHAKVQQKNRKMQVQARKNMRLLHNIGKRRASSQSTFISP